MPRRKKNEQSPTRVPGEAPAGGDFGLGPLHGYDVASASNFSSSKGSSDRQKITQNMRDIFSRLDPEVIHMVLSEVDFKVENAMDSLLELSIAAELAAPVGSPVSGFESTAAALLSPHHVSQPVRDPGSLEASDHLTLPSSTSLLTEELDLQVDQELQNLTAQQEVRINSQCSSADMTLSSLSAPQFPEQVFPELLQFNQKPECGQSSDGQPCLEGGLVHSGGPSPFDGLNIREHGSGDGLKSVVDFTHLVAEESADKPKPQLDLVASGRPSAFHLYKKDESSEMFLEQAGPVPSENRHGGLGSQVTTPLWNLHSPAFSPRLHGNKGPCFITPIAPSHPSIGHLSPWTGQFSQAPLRHSATIPKSWATAAAAHNPGGIAPARSSRLRLEGKVLVLLRGPPGSGKSTLARALVEHNPGGVALSTDDYFTVQGHYHFDPATLGEAHEWNHKRAKEAFERGANPIIIDNTNMQGWEMKPYVAQALKHNYKVLFRETDTWWKNKPRELERRSKHGVSVETIRRMLNGYEHFVTVKSIMGALLPESKQRLHLENRNIQCLTPEAKCPDLVSEPGLMDRRKNSQSQLFSSLPDVSSIDHPSEVHKLEDNHNSTDSIDFQPIGRVSEHSDRDVNLDLGALDSELDSLNQSNGEQGIPDCIVESVMNEDQHSNELPVAFSESIKQRLPRERPTRKIDSTNPAKDIDQSDDLPMEKEQMNKEASVRSRVEGEMSNMLHFVGDWPSEGPLDQRQARRNQSREDRGVSKEVTNDKGNVTEFQKLLDLIQTGVVTCQSGSSCSSPLSVCLQHNLETDDNLEESLSCWSESEEKGQNMNTEKSGRVDLPDCILDWKAAESCKGNGEILKTENETSGTTVLDIGCETEPDAAADTLPAVAAYESVGPKESCGTECDSEFVFAGNTKTDTKNCKEQIDNELTVKPKSRRSSDATDPLELESCVLSGCTQERKQRQSRRSGKQCKLALTFTQNCLAPSLNTLESPNTTLQMVDIGQSAITTHPDCETRLSPKLDFCTKLNKDDLVQSDSRLSSERDRPSQTEPQDFSLLWRLNHQDARADSVVAASSYCSDITILCGVSSRFVPEVASAVSAAVAVHPSTQNTVPYRMVHEKSTQVEDKEFVAAHSRHESLTILSRHFKLVSFDTLEDLYDKCHQDLEWTTNLLLDSGERLFRDEEVLEDMHEEDTVEVEQSTTLLGTSLETKLGDQLPYAGSTAGADVLQQYTHEAVSEIGEASDTDSSGFVGTASPAQTKNLLDTHSHTVTATPSLPTLETHDVIEHKALIEELSFATPDEIASLEEVHRLLQAELDDLERDERQKKDDRRSMGNQGCKVLNIDTVELKLPTELALQLIELFGPVGVEPGTCSSEDYALQMDMNLAKLLHQKWRETIQERQRQATLSSQLLLDGPVPWNETQMCKPTSHFPSGKDGGMPVMDHWNMSQPCVSLRDIIKEELAMQENMKKARQNRADLSRRDGASMLKEDQLYSRFPSIDRHFLHDIFRDHNYCLSQTELFLNSLLDQGPVKTVVAPELPHSDHHRTPSKEREKKLPDSDIADSHKYQDIEDPEYQDFRAEASLQRSRQLESFSKAAAAYKQGHKGVASFYAQQGHLHGQRMREANHRAAVQIFERVNSSLLPKNILDLHGLHVDEALEHLRRILHDKTADCEQGLCRPQLSVITGRGNHSQGGVARIRPAVINYLNNTNYRFTEPKPGLLVVSLK
ncbi:NEDD4-binding protein 2 [Hippocampus comes]|uniref:NEDD4-binding protein 2 n=1 Tax=Hippocampus comes TaxID=109280 RepID=UPI00094F1554|nr:PREDICTED: NEDD4-binding protein 2 [Hippocampus comes]